MCRPETKRFPVRKRESVSVRTLEGFGGMRMPPNQTITSANPPVVDVNGRDPDMPVLEPMVPNPYVNPSSSGDAVTPFSLFEAPAAGRHSRFGVANRAFQEYREPHSPAETMTTEPSNFGVANRAFQEYREPNSSAETMTTQSSNFGLVNNFFAAGHPRLFDLERYPVLSRFIAFCEQWFHEHVPLEGLRATIQLLVDKIFMDNHEDYCVFIVDACLTPYSSLHAGFSTTPRRGSYRLLFRHPLILAKRAWALYIFNHQPQPVTFYFEYKAPKFAARQLELDVFARYEGTDGPAGDIVSFFDGIRYRSTYIFHPIIFSDLDAAATQPITQPTPVVTIL